MLKMMVDLRRATELHVSDEAFLARLEKQFVGNRRECLRCIEPPNDLCGECNGSGTTYINVFRDPRQYLRDIPCARCNGTGKRTYTAGPVPT